MKKSIRFCTVSFVLTLLLAIPACVVVQEDKSVSASQPSSLPFQVKRARLFLSAEGTGDRLKDKGQLRFREFNQPDEYFPTIMLDPKRTFQVLEGFGGALTDAAAETLAKLPEKKQAEILAAYFDPQLGIGYNFCRTHINSCDFSSESYAYSEVNGDTELDHFTIAHDKKFRIPLIKSAMELAGEEFKLLASPWSPPAWMKTNNNMLKGGKLKKKYAQTWADYYVKFIESYKSEGIPIWGLTVQNEPMAEQIWESCIYTAQEERDFVKNFLGPTLESSGLDGQKVIIWDHNRGIMNQRAQVVYDDPEAEKYVWGTGFHWYTGDHFENVKLHHEAFPQKKMVFTEGCVFPFDYEKIDDWSWGERYGESIIHDLNNSAVGWIDWNILLDESGGPNHVANFCYAPVIGDTRSGEVFYMSSFYYLGHFSKFIRPGAKRIICASNKDDMLATAFINPDGTVASVVMNPNDYHMDFKVWIEGKGIEASLPAHSIITLIIE